MSEPSEKDLFIPLLENFFEQKEISKNATENKKQIEEKLKEAFEKYNKTQITFMNRKITFKATNRKNPVKVADLLELVRTMVGNKFGQENSDNFMDELLEEMTKRTKITVVKTLRVSGETE